MTEESPLIRVDDGLLSRGALADGRERYCNVTTPDMFMLLRTWVGTWRVGAFRT
jgi:hypothetical protein